MAGINTARVVWGGIVAGLIINISQSVLNVVVIGEQMEAALAARNLPPVGGSVIGAFVAMCFLLGLLIVWLYAAVRPRLGPGPQTAACIGLVIWSVIHLWGGVGGALIGWYSWNIAAIAILWGLAESVLAAIGGAYFYKE